MSVVKIIAIMSALGTTWRFNPGDTNANIVLSNNNRTMTLPSASSFPLGCRGTPFFMNAGKWYIETIAVAVFGASQSIGIGNASQSTGNTVGSAIGSCGYAANGSVLLNGSSAATYASYTSGDVMGVAVDASALRIWFSKNGVWQSGSPGSGTGGLGITADTYFPMVVTNTGGAWTIPPAARYTPPSGFAIR